MTFSIVARDPQTGDVGVAVASKFLAVGALVPWVRAKAGAVATQSYVNPTFGPDGLTLFQSGLSAPEVSAQFQHDDPGIAQRQYGLVDAAGHSATYTLSLIHI